MAASVMLRAVFLLSSLLLLSAAPLCAKPVLRLRRSVFARAQQPEGSAARATNAKHLAESIVTERRRRGFMNNIGLTSLGLYLSAIYPSESIAAAPWEPKALPRPLNVPRDRIVMDMAVTLMRSSYDVTDLLDICPMDDFQTQFYKKRVEYQSEYVSAFFTKENVNQRAGSVMIGDLSDPQYFDFISYVQYAVINDQINLNRKVFEEAQGVFGDEGDFENKLIVRDPKLGDRDTIIKLHGERVGDMVLDHLVQEKGLAVSVKERPGIDVLCDNFKKILDMLVENGFCASYTIDTSVKTSKPDPMRTPSQQPYDIRGDRCISVTFERPINLWSQQALVSQNYSLKNNFEAKVLQAFLRRCGVNSRYQTRYASLSIGYDFFLDGYVAPSTASVIPL